MAERDKRDYLNYQSDYFCKSCKKDWEDAVSPYCQHCGSPFRTSEYEIQLKEKRKNKK